MNSIKYILTGLFLMIITLVACFIVYKILNTIILFYEIAVLIFIISIFLYAAYEIGKFIFEKE